jgi:hypothetical protein
MTLFALSMSVPAGKAGMAWGMREKSSQANHTLAALRSFGLIEYEGMGPARTVSPTVEGRTYLRSQSEAEKQRVLKQCAVRPRIIRNFWAMWGVDRPADGAAFDVLTVKNGFSKGGAANFLKVYDDTIAFAGCRGIVRRPLRLPAGKHSRGVAVNQNGQQQRRMVGRRSRAPIASAHGRNVQPVNHFDNEPCQMPLRKPLIHRWWQKVSGSVTCRSGSESRRS